MDPFGSIGPLIEIRLRSGRGIWARSYHVAETYAGVLEGTPDEESNEWRLRMLPENLQRAFGSWPVHVIEPILTLSQRASAWRRREIRLLPPVEVAARFTSGPVKDGHGSSLIFAWFQFADSPLISDENRSRLVEIEWDNLAEDFEY